MQIQELFREMTARHNNALVAQERAEQLANELLEAQSEIREAMDAVSALGQHVEATLAAFYAQQ
jgi:hypothetical protein